MSSTSTAGGAGTPGSTVTTQTDVDGFVTGLGLVLYERLD